MAEGGSRPAGISVGRSLEIRPGLALDVLRDTVAAIDLVHGDGDLPTIPMGLQSIWPREGRFLVDPTTGQPIAIEIDADDPARLAILHEIGHFLDYAGFGKSNRFASNTNRLLRPWRQAVRTSQAFRAFASIRENGVVDVRQPDGTWHAVSVRPSYLRYFMTYNELWARSYAQFVVLRSRRTELLAELNDRRREHAGVPYYPRYWQDIDFEPIGAAIEVLFRRLKWIA